jgi:hypothetical protein
MQPGFCWSKILRAVAGSLGPGTTTGRKRSPGSEGEKSLGTSDRKIAERRLKAWIDSLDRVVPEVEKMNLEDIFSRLMAVNAGRKPIRPICPPVVGS